MSSLGYLICMPFAALVRVFYNLTESYGLAIILFTLVLKLILLPLQMKSKRSMLRMSRMSGKLQEIQKKYANNTAKMNEEVQKLYTEEGINPMTGCLWSFLPLPILIALYSIIRQPITHFMMLSTDVLEEIIAHVTEAGIDMSTIVQMKDGFVLTKDGLTQLTTYGQINLVKAITSQMPDYGESINGWINVNYDFLGLDLAANPANAFTGSLVGWAAVGLILIPILAGLSQFVLTKVTMKAQPQQGPGMASTKMMLWLMPIISVYIAFAMPAALGIYWIAQSVFSLIQEIFLNRFYIKKMEAEEAAKYEARQAERRKRMEEGRKKQEQINQQTEQKQTLREKQRAALAAKAEKAKKAAYSTTEAGRVGDRPYARGRSYKADRYQDKQ